MPNETAQLPFFSLDNAEHWILDHPFHLFRLWRKAACASALEKSPEKPSEVTLGKRRATSPPPQNDPDVIMISDNDDDTPGNKSRKFVPKSGKAWGKRRKIKQESPAPEILDLTGLCSESSDTDGESAAAGRRQQNRRETRTVPVKDLPDAAHDQIDRKAGIRITRKEKVERIVNINKIPTGWDVSKKLTAYLLTLDDDAPFLKTDEKSISSWIRHEVRLNFIVFFDFVPI